MNDATNIRIDVILNADGRIVGWYEVDEGGYLLPEDELTRFSSCSGNYYRTLNDTLVYDEALEPVTVPQPKTDTEIILQSLVDLDYRLTLQEMGVSI